MFEDTKAAFKTKSNRELNRALLLFNTMNNKTFVEAGIFFTKLSLKLHLPVEGIINVSST